MEITIDKIKSRVSRRLRRAYNSIRFHLRTNVKKHGDQIIYVWLKDNDGFYFPYGSRMQLDYRQLHNMQYDLPQYLLKKYQYDGYKIEKGDTVIDCGAFVGGFSVGAIQAGAGKVYSIEPSSKNFGCLGKNINKYDTHQITQLIKAGLGSESGIAQLNHSISGCDDSILTPDEGGLNSYEEINIYTLHEFAIENKLDGDSVFLKVEAEGFEPEIIKGLGQFRPRVITVDVTPERNHESPRHQIQKLLEAKGYKTFAHTDRCLFCRR